MCANFGLQVRAVLFGVVLMQSDSMTMEESADGGVATMHSTANATDHTQPAINQSSAQLFSLYDDEDDVDMQTVRPPAVLVKSLTPPHSPELR